MTGDGKSPFLCDDGVKHANISVLESQGQARSIM